MARRAKYYIDKSECTGCGACLDVCPKGAIYMVDCIAEIDETHCTSCGKCVEVCPHYAIQWQQTPVFEAAPEAPLRIPTSTSLSAPPLVRSTGSFFSEVLSKLRDFVGVGPRDFSGSSPFKSRPPGRGGHGHGKRLGARRRRRW